MKVMRPWDKWIPIIFTCVNWTMLIRWKLKCLSYYVGRWESTNWLDSIGWCRCTKKVLTGFSLMKWDWERRYKPLRFWHTWLVIEQFGAHIWSSFQQRSFWIGKWRWKSGARPSRSSHISVQRRKGPKNERLFVYFIFFLLAYAISLK